MNIIHKGTRGFTMVELIIVMGIIGILSAVALPRFLGTSVNAKATSREAIKASLNASLVIAHAQWLANGSRGAVTLDGSTQAIIMNASGYPDIGTTYNSASDCQDLVHGLVSNLSGLTITHASNMCIVRHQNWASDISLTSTNAI